NIPGKHPLVIARKQIQLLRGVCADPSGVAGGPPVRSNFNPKQIAILEIVRDVLAKGEQVVIVSARVGQTTSLAHRLEEAGISIARIDSTHTPDKHAAEANRFKAGKARVMLMGV